MRSIEFNWFDDIGNLLLGLCESVGSVSTAATAAGILPDCGIAAGLMDTWYVLAWKKNELKDSSYSIENEYASAPLKQHSPLLMTAKFCAGVFSLVEGMENLGSFTLGTPGLLPIALATRSGVDLLCAMETFYYARKNSKRGGNPLAAFADIIKKAVAFTGWCLIATGNPLGWAFLVTSAALSFGARAKWLGGHGLFPFGKKTATKPKNNDLEEFASGDEFTTPPTTSVLYRGIV